MSDAPRVRFLGAAQTVTGSRYWLRAGGRSYLFECGVFQGDDELEQRDWRPMPFKPAELDAVVLTHAHIDHSGYVPRLVADGYRGPVYASAATCDLLGILLPDSGFIMEEQAEYANRKGYARHLPARPLYTRAQAEASLRQLRALPYREPVRVDDVLDLTLRPAGHILGSATVEARFRVGGRTTSVVFSGDLGRSRQALMRAPEPVREADFLFVEGTYGDRDHPAEPPERGLEREVLRVVDTGGALVIPSFAVGRAQAILYHLRMLEEAGRIPQIPIFVDSPMARDATDIHCAHGDELNLAVDLLQDAARCPLRGRDTRFVRSPQESRALNGRRGPIVILSANGMCTAGRIRHHLRARLPDERNTILFVGYQAPGTLGARIEAGAPRVRIHGREVEVRARVEAVGGLSAHADRGELLTWMRGFERPPRRTFLVHGESAALRSLQRDVERELGWATSVPGLDDEVELR